MKKLFTTFVMLSLISLGRTYAQSNCVNADFSAGNFTDWTGSVGENDGTTSGLGYTAMTAMVVGTPNQSPYSAGQQTIMNTVATDPNTANMLNVLPPNGANSCMLGNAQVEACDNATYPQAAQLEYTIAVTTSNSTFNYQYAVVLQNPNHTASEQPRFVINVMNSSGVSISSYVVTAASGLPGWITCAPASQACESDSVEWKGWSTGVVDLMPYIGQTVTVQFTSFDCTPGGHFGYAYISCFCGTPNYQLTQQCMGDSVIVTAPTGFSKYVWNNGDSTKSIVVNNPVAGDTVSCMCISSPDTITLKAAVSTIPVTGLTASAATTCNGVATTVSASGGAYTYLWNTGQTSASITVAPTIATNYTVTATSSGGCTASTTTVVTVNPLPTGTITSTPTSCTSPTGTITITPTVGTAPFTYAWNTIPQQTTQTATGLAQGSYTVVLTDSNGCSSAITGSVSPNVIITLSDSSTNAHCGNPDGTASVTAYGGTPPYAYLWSTVPVQQTTAKATNLPAGTYNVTVTDSVGCMATSSVTINNLAGPTVQFTSVVNDSCGVNNGSANIVVSGGSAPYTFEWNNGETTQSIINLPYGNYCVTVTDAYNCPASDCVTIQSIPPTAPEICIVTVDTNSNHCMIIWDKPVTSSISKYYIYRESAVAGVYDFIGTQSYSASSSFIDTSSDALQQSYRYELALNDICGDTTQQSSYHQTIHLAINAGQGGVWNLIWNAYIGFTFGTYDIYRGTNATNLTLLDSVSSNVTSYTDLTPPSGTVYYLVEAVRPSACILSKIKSTISTTVSNIANGNNTGINKFDANNFIQISPNPGNGIFTLTLQRYSNQISEINIFNSLGQLIRTLSTSGIKTNINISDIPSGVYVVEVKTEKEIWVKKLVKE